MKNRLFALLVHDRPYPLETLRAALKDLSVDTCSVPTCEELDRLMSQTHPHLIFTDTLLRDGTWTQVINLAEKADVPTNVIVVGEHEDMKLYVSVMERGAFDFVLPPFEAQGLDFLLTSAEYDLRRRRQTLLGTGASGEWQAAS